MKVIVGLGKTGLSVASLFAREDVPFSIMDSRANPPMLDEFKALGTNATCYLNGFNVEVLAQADEVIVSPGVSLNEPELVGVSKSKIIGDIELFARRARAPVVAITGTNGKSTVTSLFGYMCQLSGLCVQVGGNIGVPALTLLEQPLPDLYVLELSSFQLLITRSLKTKASVILNLSEDHLDRHGDMLSYAQAKHRIFEGCECPVINKSDLNIHFPRGLTQPLFYNDKSGAGFALKDQRYVTLNGRDILDIATCDYVGAFYGENAVAALSLGVAIDLPLDAMLKAIKAFKGLPHRTEWVACSRGINWYNDSKGTNISATLAAIDAIGRRTQGQTILIAGGSDKHSDFKDFVSGMSAPIKAAVLLGETRYKIGEALKPYTQVVLVDNMDMAVKQAAMLAVEGDSVLLSPACASFDMYNNFEQRGDDYIKCVKENT